MPVPCSRREQQLTTSGKQGHYSKKKLRPILYKAGERLQKKRDLVSASATSPDMFSTSPDSPGHQGAAARPGTVVRENPMYRYLEEREEAGSPLLDWVRTLGESISNALFTQFSLYSSD